MFSRLVTCQAQLQVPLCTRPFRGQDTVHHGIPNSSVSARVMVTYHAILLGAQAFNRALRRKIEIIRAPPDDFAADGFERVFKQQQLARCIDMSALAALRVPGVTNLHAVSGCNDIVKTGATNDLATALLPPRPGQHLTGPFPPCPAFHVSPS